MSESEEIEIRLTLRGGSDMTKENGGERKERPGTADTQKRERKLGEELELPLKVVETPYIHEGSDASTPREPEEAN